MKTLFPAVVAPLVLAAGASLGHAQTLQPPFDASYTIQDLGSIPGVPTNYGGVEFLDGNANVLLIGGNANGASGKLFRIDLQRDANGHITGFVGTATEYAESAYIDGGLDYEAGSKVLFASRYPNGELGMIKPGSTITDKVVDLNPLGLSGSLGGLQFVPPSYPGSGSLKLASYNTGGWYTATLVPDGNGTFDVTALSLDETITGGPEGVVYVPPLSPEFTDYRSMLVSEYGNGAIAAYDIDNEGDPIPATRRLFITGLSGAEGGVVDPVTGDFVFSTFGGANRVITVSGFSPPCGEDAFWANYGTGWPGTNGFPTVTLDSDPVINELTIFSITNSRGAAAYSLIFVGGTAIDQQTGKGGRLLVLHDTLLSLIIPANGTDIPFTIPDVPQFCGLDVFVQVLQQDPGASKGISFSDGLQMHFGS